MAGLSITRRRKAWLNGVAYGASGKGKCLLHVTKLVDIFQRGVLHGRANIETPYVRAVIDQEERRRQPRIVPQQPRQSGGGDRGRIPPRRPSGW